MPNEDLVLDRVDILSPHEQVLTGIKSLPGEIRAAIYTILVPYQRRLSIRRRFPDIESDYPSNVVYRKGPGPHFDSGKPGPLSPTTTINLMLTCRLFYSEVSSLLYGENSFRFEDHLLMANFINLVGSQNAALLTNLYCKRMHIWKVAPVTQIPLVIKMPVALAKCPNLKRVRLPGPPAVLREDL